MNWNILVTSGKEIKRDSMISVNESREAYLIIKIYRVNPQIYCNKMNKNKNLFKGKYNQY